MLRGLAGPELVGEKAPGVPQIRPSGESLELPVHEHERAETKARAEHSRSTGGVMSLGGVPLYLEDTEPAAAIESATAQLERYDREIAQAAAPVLSSAQLAAFKAFQKERRQTDLDRMRVMLSDMRPRKMPKP